MHARGNVRPTKIHFRGAESFCFTVPPRLLSPYLITRFPTFGLVQSNRTMDISSSFSSNDIREAQNEKQNGRSWGRRSGGFSKREEEVRDENKEVERSMQEELLAARNAGGDVDRLVMKELLARVRVSGPNTAFKALASIEVCVRAYRKRK